MAASPFRADFLVGKVALITGGGTGICNGIARAFVAHGAHVAIMGRRLPVLEAAAVKLRELGGGKRQVLAVQGDVRDPIKCQQSVDAVLAKFGRLDILVVRANSFSIPPNLCQNGAAGNFLCAANDLSYNAFRTVMEIDLVGTFSMSKAAFAALKESKGQIINITAVRDLIMWWQAHAASAKAAIDQMSRNLALEWAEYGIRVNCIAPGAIQGTEGMSRLSGGALESGLMLIPLQRLGTAEDIAQAALYLVSTDWVTGQVLAIDGGSAIARPGVPKDLYLSLQQSRRAKM